MKQDLAPNQPTPSNQTPEVLTQPLRRLMDKPFFQQLLGVKERKFDEMDATGLIPAAKFIGPRTRRWVYPDDFNVVLTTLATAKKAPEPPTLAAGRRRRIEALKAGRVNAAT